MTIGAFTTFLLFSCVSGWGTVGDDKERRSRCAPRSPLFKNVLVPWFISAEIIISTCDDGMLKARAMNSGVESG